MEKKDSYPATIAFALTISVALAYPVAFHLPFVIVNFIFIANINVYRKTVGVIRRARWT